MVLEAWGKSEPGQGRPAYGDSFLVRPDLGLFIVADGAGDGGSIASQTAVDALANAFGTVGESRERRSDDRARAIEEMPALMDRAIQDASERVYERSKTGAAGTTSLTALLLGRDRGAIGHAGNTRLYLLRNGDLHLLTQDHTYRAARLRAPGLPLPNGDGPEASALTRSLGSLPRIEADCLPLAQLPGDTYLLCSDGLYAFVPEEDLGKLLGDPTPAALPDRLIALVRERGGRDDCTAVVIRATDKNVDGEVAAVARRIAALSKLEIFGSLSQTDIVRLLGRFDEREVGANDILIKEEDEGDEMFVIVTGRVEVRTKGRLIRYLEAGNHVGEFALIDRHRRSATVTATEPTQLLVMTAKTFADLKREDPARALSFYEAFARRLSLSLREASEFLVRFY